MTLLSLYTLCNMINMLVLGLLQLIKVSLKGATCISSLEVLSLCLFKCTQFTSWKGSFFTSLHPAFPTFICAEEFEPCVPCVKIHLLKGWKEANHVAQWNTLYVCICKEYFWWTVLVAGVQLSIQKSWIPPLLVLKGCYKRKKQNLIQGWIYRHLTHPWQAQGFIAPYSCWWGVMEEWGELFSSSSRCIPGRRVWPAPSLHSCWWKQKQKTFN